MRATRMEDMPEIAAAHLLARDLFCATRRAFFEPESWDATDSRWLSLTTAEKDRLIETARLLLETYRPYPLRASNAVDSPRQIVTGLGGKVVGGIFPSVEIEPNRCVYCSRVIEDESRQDYCSGLCEAAAQGEGA